MTTFNYRGCREALYRLHQHIDHEEHGLVPAAVIMLPLAAWDRITPDQFLAAAW
ncbi:hypothetical protein [Nonomuraea sp. NPDC049480]|uniref:hypothetical protein n=1 Tax=Nonomuraea sp. NPDC049480 TaxID=3364353 RepID=UPI0037BE01AD